MPKRKKNSRLDTYNKLIDEDFQNILLLRKFIKTGNPLDYFNEDLKIERKENENEQ